MNDITILNQKGNLVVGSREVAKNFEKRHDHVLRDIDNIKESGVTQNWGDLFYETTYVHPQNKQEYREILMNRDGFTLLAMGFTGRQALEWKLKYIDAFNEMEEKIKNQAIPTDLSPQLQVLINMELKQKQLENSIAETKEEVTGIKENILVEVEEWRDWANAQLRKMGANLGDYRRPYKESYTELEKRAGCNLERRLNKKIERMEKAGATKTAINNTNNLDVINEDKKLKEIYTNIVKAMSIKYL